MSETINAGNAAPAPTSVVCARCGGAIEPGLARCPTCGAPQSRLQAQAGPGSGLLGGLIGGLVIFLAVAWVWPDLFRFVHLGWVADWFGVSTARRVWMMLPMSAIYLTAQVVRQRRASAATGQASTPFARTTGGRVENAPNRLEAGAWTGGIEARTRAQRWLLTLDTERQRSNVATRLRAVVTPRRDLHLAVLPQSRIIKAMISPRIGRLLLRLGQSAAAGAPPDEERRHVLDELSFVIGPAIELGEPEFDRAFLIKCDDEAAARALLGDLRGPLLALHRPDRWWQLTLISAVADGRGLLEYREGGIVRDAARLEAVQQAMTRMLELLAAAGIIAEAGPSAKP